MRRLGWIVVAVGVGWPCAASAQAGRTLDGGGDQAEARARFYTGAQLYQEGDHEGALAEFRESHRLFPAAVASFNVAQTLRALHRYHEAVRIFRRYLRESGDEIDPGRRRQVQRTIRELERRIAPITLEIEPAGAQIRVDGRAVGEAPLSEPLLLGAGRRVLEITADGYVPVRDELEVVGQQPRTVQVRLARHQTAGTARITSTPEEANIRIDGLEVGPAPVERRLPGGGHVVEAFLDGYEVYRTSIELADRQRLDLNVVLDEAREPGVLEQWWFWTGAAAVVVGAVITIAVVASQPSEPEPIPGNSVDRVISVLLER